MTRSKRNPKLDGLVRSIHTADLTAAETIELAEVILALADAKGTAAGDDSDLGCALSKGDNRTLNGGQGAYVELKMINGCGPYAYLRWRSGRRLRSQYLGKPESLDI